MIELRWLKKQAMQFDEYQQAMGYAEEMVLQYRVREGPQGEDWWGEWTDVPTEQG